jgi:hypothetical protein
MDNSMKFEIGAVLLAAMALAGCMGPQGNPNGQAYATDPGGTVAVSPQAVGTVAYDPYGKAPSFADMEIGSAAIAPPPPPPMTLTPPSPAPRRPGSMQH